ncbi:hypothetical protein BTO20_00675 [Mycobacterium dioxanotrophicus]|uniref:Uncharacterized protein n=1 Tax=Mycobacterium dioxanotrophicus TaxID=482462 RepID=A0A1Y0BWM4_9MYCO|nr:hypothetical protein BTO20_00675 [Mycobacterium dioxanotrophicus]
MDWFDRRILTFILLWAPFGEPPDDEVFEQFGLRKDLLMKRFAEIASRECLATAVSDDDHVLIGRARRLLLESLVVRPWAAHPGPQRHCSETDPARSHRRP